MTHSQRANRNDEGRSAGRMTRLLLTGAVAAGTLAAGTLPAAAASGQATAATAKTQATAKAQAAGKTQATAKAQATAKTPATAKARAAAPAGRTFTVSSVQDLAAKVKDAQPGDRIELADGTYTFGSAVKIDAKGTKEAPITIAAATRGKAILKGAKTFTFGNASYITITGFEFRQRDQLLIPGSASRVRLTRNVFEFEEPTTKNNWVAVEGDDVRLDRNTFRHKKSQGVFLQVDGPDDTHYAQRTRVDQNYFYDHAFTGDNGGEAIRLGYGDKGHIRANAVIEGNLFTKTNGDEETVSVKASGNTVKRNTFTDLTRGSVTLRAGNDNTVSGNFLIGAAKLQVYGAGHKVLNNYLDGTGQLVLGTGDDAHEASSGVLVAFNTLVGRDAEVLRTNSRGVAASDNTIANNLILGTGGKTVRITQGNGFTWEGNVFWGGATGKPGDIPADGFVKADPKLKADDHGVRRLTADSLKVAAIARAAGSYPDVTEDINGRTRPSDKHVGAEQYDPASELVQLPLTPAGVGPSAP
ncbi:polysaccharide lyase 6 family protein [Streptomyces sp. NPDC003077]|uniref:polysaccharide lyase 6 family protein n=1 Tax=Streptomyces sp. NPDC003077 TaxID=3154443 RepID=UPI0033AB34CB